VLNRKFTTFNSRTNHSRDVVDKCISNFKTMEIKRQLIIAVFLFSIINLFAQVKKDSLYYTGEIEAMKFVLGLTNNIESSRDYIAIFNELISHSEYFKYSGYLDLIAPWYNNVGHYNKGIELGDIAFPQVKQEQLFDHNDYNIADALSVILEKSKYNQVIMINEEHRMSRQGMIIGII